MRFQLSHPSRMSMAFGWQPCSPARPCCPQCETFNKCYDKGLSCILQVIKKVLNRAGCKIDSSRALLARCLWAENHTAPTLFQAQLSRWFFTQLLIQPSCPHYPSLDTRSLWRDDAESLDDFQVKTITAPPVQQSCPSIIKSKEDGERQTTLSKPSHLLFQAPSNGHTVSLFSL